jgi:sortase A
LYVASRRETATQLFTEQEYEMGANLNDVIAEAGGSEEFREILWVLIQEKQEGDGGAVQQSTTPRRNIWIWTERVLLASGLALLGLYGAARLESFISSRTALSRFAATAPLSTSTSDEVPESTGPSRIDFSRWDEHRIQAYKESLNGQSGVPLAVLHISKIGLEVPLLDGTDSLTLNHAVGRISGTARPGERGNIGIAGHRDGFFRGLKDIAIGDRIELKVPERTVTYVVDEINIVRPTDVNVLRPRSAPSLTLITCYPFYFIGSAPQRYVVHASRTRF